MRHLPVAKTDAVTATGRCRLVVDGSPLTKFLAVGEHSHRDIQRILYLWRLADGFSVADISSAYMRLPVHTEDSKFLCIWWRNTLYQFKSLPMGISPSASFLQGSVDTFLQNWLDALPSGPRTFGPTVLPTPFMDDLICLLFNQPDVKTVTPAIEDAVSRSLASYFNEHGLVTSLEKLANSVTCNKLLGVHLNEQQEIVLHCSKLAKFDLDRVLTRRRMLQCVASIYDPFGLLSEFSLWGRILTARAAGLPWDSPVDARLDLEFRLWLKVLKSFLPISVPRRLSFHDLVIFTDASKSATGVLICLRGSDTKWHRYLGKSEMLKSHQRSWTASSKLELLGIHRTLLLLKRLFDILGETPFGRFPRGKVILATDSETNLHRFADPEIASHVTDGWERRCIIECTNLAVKLSVLICHVDGKRNPADALSRGTFASSNMNTRVQFENDAAQMVFDYPETRFVKPQKISVTKIACNRVIEEEAVVREDVLLEKEIPVLGLNERYLTERESESVCFESWFHKYQSSDAYVLKLIGNRAVILNGRWSIAGRQDLEGTPLWRILVPKKLIPSLLKTSHDNCGHVSNSKLQTILKDKYQFGNMTKIIRAYVQRCHICQQVRGYRKWSSRPGYLYSDGKPFSVIGVDVLKVTKTAMVLTVTDLYTRFIFAFCFGMIE